MNRTQRAIKRQYRESEAAARKKKQNEVEKMLHSTNRGLMDRKANAAKNVKIFASEEKEMKKITHDYKARVLSEKNNKEVVRV